MYLIVFSRRSGYRAFCIVSAASTRLLMLMPDRSLNKSTESKSNEVSPRVRRDDMPPADGSSIQKSLRIYVRPRTGPQSAHLWWPAVAKLQRAYRLGSCAMQPACL